MSKSKRPFPQFDGNPTTPVRPHPPRQLPAFRSDFGDGRPPRRKQQLAVPDCSLDQIEPPRPSAPPVNNENVTTVAKIRQPPNIRSTHPRPSTPRRSLSPPNLSSFLSPSRSRPSKPMSSTHMARATDVLTDSGRAELLGLTLAQDDATPMEKAVRRGLETTPRKAGVGKEIRYIRGGLAERASQVLGRKTTSLSLWRKSNPLPESADMLVEIEQVLSAPKPPPQRGAPATLIFLVRCRVIGEDASMVVLLSVPAHDARNVPLTSIKAGSRVGLWSPLKVDDVYLCSRFVVDS